MQLIVLGMHRSGTSAVTRLLNLMGAYVGPDEATTAPNEENPKGFWERRDLRAICDGLLTAADRTWWAVSGFDLSEVDDDESATHLEAFSETLTELNEHQPWVVKEPRMCLLLPLLRPMLSRPVAVVVHRDPIEIARSLEARNQFPVAAGVALWEHYVRSALAAAHGMPLVFVRHADVMSDPVATVKRLHDDLVAEGVDGLSVPGSGVIEEFISADLYRSKAGTEERAVYLNCEQNALAQQLDDADLSALRAAKPVTNGAVEILRLLADSVNARAAAQERAEVEQQVEEDFRRRDAEAARLQDEIKSLAAYGDDQRAHIRRLERRVAKLEKRGVSKAREQELRQELEKSEAARQRIRRQHQALKRSRLVRVALKARAVKRRLGRKKG